MNARQLCCVSAAPIAMFVAGIAFSTAAHTETPGPPCVVAPLPEVVLQRLNDARQHGVACHPTDPTATAVPLRWNLDLTAVAAAQARDMAVRGRMEHRDRENRDLKARLVAYGYPFKIAAENLAFGYESLDDVVGAWLDSESHCANLMNAKLSEFGIACSDSVTAAVPGEGRYWTMVLGTPSILNDRVKSW